MAWVKKPESFPPFDTPGTSSHSLVILDTPIPNYQSLPVLVDAYILAMALHPGW
jgi:hypothetical protein